VGLSCRCSPSLEVLQASLDGALGSLSQWGMISPWQGDGTGQVLGPFQPKSLWRKLFCVCALTWKMQNLVHTCSFTNAWMYEIHLSEVGRDVNYVFWVILQSSFPPVILPQPHCRFFLSARRRLERNPFNCSCDIRWIQLWQEKGEANLQSQQLHCMNLDTAVILLRNMNITQCGKVQPIQGYWEGAGRMPVFPSLMHPAGPFGRELGAALPRHVVKGNVIEDNRGVLCIKIRIWVNVGLLF